MLTDFSDTTWPWKGHMDTIIRRCHQVPSAVLPYPTILRTLRGVHEDLDSTIFPPNLPRPAVPENLLQSGRHLQCLWPGILLGAVPPVFTRVFGMDELGWRSATRPWAMYRRKRCRLDTCIDQYFLGFGRTHPTNAAACQLSTDAEEKGASHLYV